MITSFLLSSQLALNNKSQIFPLIMKEKFAMKEYFSSLLNKTYNCIRKQHAEKNPN